MEEYYFLFGLAFLWTLFAVIQDLRKREVANWLNFSFLAFALVYRAFYAVSSGREEFFYFGVFGFLIFYAIAEGLYYSKAFGGGDARLLRAFGVILPFESFFLLIGNSIGFIFTLFFIGAAYTIVWSIFSLARHFGNFKEEFIKIFIEQKKILYISLIAIIAVLLVPMDSFLKIYAVLLLLIIPLLYYYLKAIERSCFVKLTDAEKLTEGDWLEKDVKIGNRVIKKSIHGLSIGEIKELRKAKKKVWIKEGIPFVPVFLITLIIMGFFYLAFGIDFAYLLKALF